MNQNNQDYQDLLCNAKSRSQMADEYGIHRKTLTAWIKRHQLPITAGNLCAKEQELIYRTFGKPIIEFKQPDNKKDVPKSAKREQRGTK
jgi:abortive infection bacteriophage resistance protein